MFQWHIIVQSCMTEVHYNPNSYSITHIIADQNLWQYFDMQNKSTVQSTYEDGEWRKSIKQKKVSTVQFFGFFL